MERGKGKPTGGGGKGGTTFLQSTHLEKGKGGKREKTNNQQRWAKGKGKKHPLLPSGGGGDHIKGGREKRKVR